MTNCRSPVQLVSVCWVVGVFSVAAPSHIEHCVSRISTLISFIIKNNNGFQFNETKSRLRHSWWMGRKLFILFCQRQVCMLNLSRYCCSIQEKYVERHYVTLHENYNTKYPSDSALRRKKVKQLKYELLAQQDTFQKPLAKAIASRVATFSIARILAKKKNNLRIVKRWKHVGLQHLSPCFKIFWIKLKLYLQ